MYSKKLYYIFIFLCINSLFIFSQQGKIDDAKEYLQSKEYLKAQISIDAATQNNKTKNNSETWYIRGLVYITIENDSITKKNYPFDLRDTALYSFKKSYNLNKDDFFKFVLTTNGGTNPILYVYNSFYQEGAKYFQAKKYLECANIFKQALAVNKYLNSISQDNKSIIDTSLIINIAIAYDNGGNKKAAAEFYEEIANAKIIGESFSQVYRWICYYYYKTAPDSIKLNKYIAIGSQVYPKDDFYSKIKLDVLRNKNNSSNKEDLFNGYEETLTKNPNDLDVLKLYAGDLFNYVHPNSGKRPDNFQDKFTKLEELYNHLIILDTSKKHDYCLDLGKHFYNKYLFEDGELKPIKALLNSLSEKKYNLAKAKGKKPAEIKKEKDELDNQIKIAENQKTEMKNKFAESLKFAVKNLEVSFNYYYTQYKNGTLKNYEKTILKDNIDLLITCNSELKDKDKETFYDSKYSEVK